MSDNHDDGRSISMLIAGFGLGALVGTVIGLLLAPKSGRELRADIAEYSKEAYDRSREKARQAYESGRERAREYSSRVGEKISEAREHLGEAAQRISKSVKTGIDAARKAHGEGPEETEA